MRENFEEIMSEDLNGAHGRHIGSVKINDRKNKLIISVLGCSPRSTTSHLLCLGLSELHSKARLVTIGPRGRLSDEKRPYNTFSVNDEKELKDVFRSFAEAKTEGLVEALVLDGFYGNRKFESVLHKYSDITILPFNDSGEGVRFVMQALNDFPGSYALPSIWPTNYLAKKKSENALIEIERRSPSRTLTPIPQYHGVTKLFYEDYGGVNSVVVNIAKNLALDVLNLGEVTWC